MSHKCSLFLVISIVYLHECSNDVRPGKSNPLSRVWVHLGHNNKFFGCFGFSNIFNGSKWVKVGKMKRLEQVADL
ncbi:hypothetical protein Hanom_Chr07g00601991 [Helianthus anomalus]